MALDRHKGPEFARGDDIVEHSADSTDAKAENQALNVKASRLSEVEQAWGIPVFGNEQRFGQPERRRKDTRPSHGRAVPRKGDVHAGTMKSRMLPTRQTRCIDRCDNRQSVSASGDDSSDRKTAIVAHLWSLAITTSWSVSAVPSRHYGQVGQQVLDTGQLRGTPQDRLLLNPLKFQGPRKGTRVDPGAISKVRLGPADWRAALRSFVGTHENIGACPPIDLDQC